MKKITPLFVFAFIVFVWQQSFSQQITHEHIPLSSPGVINFTNLALEEASHPQINIQRNLEEDEELHKGIPKKHTVEKAYVTNVTMPEGETRTQSPPPTASFNGLTDNSTIIPPDVSGSSGPNHLMENINSQYRIFNKSGGTVSTLSLTSFWSGITSGSPFCDPHVIYDPNTSKWYAVILANLNNGHSGLFLGVSQTDDPTGSWWEYSVDVQGSGTTWMDYPAIGFNDNWIVVTGNMFTSSNFFSTTKILVFDKSLVTSGSAGTVPAFTDNTIFSLEPAVTYDAGITTEYMLTEWNNNSGGNCYVKLYTITGTPSSPVYSAGNTVGTNQPYSTSQKTAPQSGTTKKIATNDTRMRTVVYRNGLLYGSQTVFLPSSSPTRAACQVWQINPSNSTLSGFYRVDDNTATNFYAFPSVTVNANDDLLVGYAVFSSSIFASAGYSYRTSTDPANTLQSNYTYKSGQTSYYKTYGGTTNRWGDYTTTTVDPVDGSFWTIQEFAYTPANIWGTVWGNVAASSGGSSCNAPSGLASSSVTQTSANLSWGSAAGAVTYNVQYKPTSSSTWASTSVGVTSTSIINLIPGTQYEFQVQTVCASGTSAYSGSSLFTTLSNGGNCTESFEPNNSKAKAAAISTNTDILSQISSSNDNDWFSFANSAGASNLKVTLTTLPADYDIKLYNPSGTNVKTSNNSGTGDETMIYNTSTVGTYKVKIYPFNGANSNTLCYTLHVYTSSTPFRLDHEAVASNGKDVLNVFPNPASDQLTLQYNGDESFDGTIRIVNMLGQVMLSQAQSIESGDHIELDISNLPNGKYLVRMNSNDMQEVKIIEVVR